MTDVGEHIVARGWSEDEKQASGLADNELAARASWDIGLLRNELRDLQSNDFDLDLIGFEPGSAACGTVASTAWPN